MQFDVFISYSSQDKSTADAACALLEEDHIRCWIAPRDILPGRDWGEAIIDAIGEAKVFVLIFSQHANESQQIKREVERAVSKGIPIIPVRIEDVLPTKSLEYFISTPHWLDAITPPLEQHLRELANTVRALLASSPSSKPLPPATKSRWRNSLVDRYFRTLVELWSNRPSNFLSNLQISPEKYASPYEFLVGTFAINFGMVFIQVALYPAILATQMPDSRSLAGASVIFAFVMLIVSTVIFRFLSWAWPVRGAATILSLFEFHCYLFGLGIPLVAINVLVEPVVLKLATSKVISGWTSLLPLGFLLLISAIIFVFYQVPAIAYLNKVTVRRMFAGVVFWYGILGLIGAAGGALKTAMGLGLL